MTLMRVNDKEMSLTLQFIPLEEQNKLDEIHLKIEYCNVAFGCGSHSNTLLIGEPRLVHSEYIYEWQGESKPFQRRTHMREKCLSHLAHQLPVIR